MAERPSSENPEETRRKRLEEIQKELDNIGREIQKLNRRTDVLERGVKLTPYKGPSLDDLIKRQQELLEEKGRLFGTED